MGPFMSWKSELLVCAEKYVSSFAAGDVQINRQHLLRCLQTNSFRDIVAAAADKSKLAIVFVQASEWNHVDVVEAFLDNGMNVDVEDKSSFTALMRASGCGKEECVRLLLDRNANVDVQSKNGYTALMYASTSISNKVKIVEMLLEKNADVNIQNKNGWTALMYTSCYGYKDIVQLLLNYGADIDLKNDAGKTASDWTKDKEIKELLLNHVSNNSYVLK